MAEVEVTQKENFKMMSEQLKKDREDTIARLKDIADSNTRLAKIASDPEERKKNLKAATKASKELATLQKADLTTTGAVKKEFGNIGNSLLGGFDGILGEAFGPLGGIASTLTTGLVRRKIEAKKNLESDILQEETSKDVADTLEENAEDAKKDKIKTDGGKVEQKTSESAEETAGGIQEVDEGLNTTNRLLTDIESHLNFMAGNQETSETRRERLRDKGGETVRGVMPGEKKGGLFGDFKFGDLFKKGGIKKIIATLGGTLMSGFGTAFAGIGKTFTSTLGPQLMKFVGPAALIAGLALAVKDGINGYFKSDEWGVSKIAGSIGGIFGGTGEAGSFGNVSGNALKWGLIGAGLGSIVPVIGTGIGFAAGALLGGILGWFGGEKIAKAVDAISDWFENKWNGFLSIFGIDKRSKSKKIDDISEDKAKLDKEISDLEKKEKEGKLSRFDKGNLDRKRKAQSAVSEREKNIKITGFDISDKEKEKRITQLSASREETETMFGGYGIAEAEEELRVKQEQFDRRTFSGPMAERNKEAASRALQAKKDEVKKMKDELKALQRTDAPVTPLARGGIIVNRPSYLPSSGTVVGEHGTFTGRGAARGGIPMDGGPEAIIPLSGSRAQGFIQPIAASIAGQVMNNLAMDRVGMSGAGGTSSAPTVIDTSSQQVITNNTIINSPEPQGQMLPGAGRDHAVSHFRHAA